MSCNIYCYAVLAIVSNSYPPLPGRLPTRYSPVRNSSARCKHQASAFYLHVLGTPPAFILSQDQTLIKIIVCLKLILSLTDLLFFSLFSTITLVIVPCTLVRLVQFSKVFVTHFSQVTTILVYHVIHTLSISFFIFFAFFENLNVSSLTKAF